jgi:hypothetical protein
MTDAWAITAATNVDVEVQKDLTQPPKKGKSAPGMCSDSPDTCHWWDIGAVGPQSAERFDCRWCDRKIWD